MKKIAFILLISIVLTGCKGQPPSVADEPVLVPTRTVGTGSGNLVVDGQALGIRPGEVVAITPGRYESLTFSGFTGTSGQRITLVANDRVEVIGGGLTLTNVSYLTVTGGVTTKNLQIHDVAYRGIMITGTIPHALTIEGIQLRNVADYAVHYNNTAPFDGTDATTMADFKLLHCDFDNAGTVLIDGVLDNSAGLVNTGFSLHPEVAYCSFKNNATAGTYLYFGNTEACDIHHNVVDNVNTRNDNHNGIFFVKGNGAVHHNKCTNHQGNFVRFWPFAQGTAPKQVLLHDNIVWNSRKYSALELQCFESSLIPGVSTYCNARVFNNTVGKLNTGLPTIFVGVVVDVYDLMGGELHLINNLSFDLVKTPGDDGVWSQQNQTVPTLNSNNRYFDTASAAGLIDVDDFRLKGSSPAKGAGLYESYLDSDFYGIKRANPPSIGAVE